MSRAKQGRVEIHWNRDRIRSDPRYQSVTEITLIKSDKWENPVSGFAIRLARADTQGEASYRASGYQFQPGRSEMTDFSIDAMLDQSPMQSNVKDKGYRYIEGLIRSIQLQSPMRSTVDTDSSVYRLQIKRAEMDIRLGWGDGDEVWPGVMDLVQALEDIYTKLLNKSKESAATSPWP